MTIFQRMEEASASLTTFIVTSVVGGFWWLVRRILTNQKQIEMLQREIQIRDERREEDREALGEVRKDVREIRAKLLGE